MKIIFYTLMFFKLLSGLDNSRFIEPSSAKQISSTLPIKNYDILESSVDPDSLFIGPGDIIEINIVSSTIVSNYDLIVDNTGFISIPVVGAIKVNSLSLSGAHQNIESIIKKRYPHAQITVMLKKAGIFKIKIIGPFNHSVYYNTTSFTTVNDVYKIFISEQKSLNKDINKISQRNIKLYRKNKVINVDLMKFKLNGDSLDNPYLRRGDVIKIGYIKHYTSIWGGVNRPQSYEYSENETVQDLVNYAGGISIKGDIENISITSFVNNNKSTQNYTLSELSQISLNPNDIIMIKENNFKYRQSIVNIVGEIKYPGPYQVDYGKTSLKDLIDIAGGFTRFADSSRILLINKNVSNTQLSPIEKPKEFTTSTDLSWALQVWENSTNQNNLYLNSGQFAKYILNQGDEVKVLPILNYVDVLGAVNAPGRITFIKQKKAKYYINQCDGVSKNAEKKIYLIKSGTQSRVPIGKNTLIERGDLIFIPESIEVNKWERFKDWMTVTSQIGTLIILLQNILN